MADSYVREVGRVVLDMDAPVRVGVDYHHDASVPEDEADCVLTWCPACRQLRPITKAARAAGG